MTVKKNRLLLWVLADLSQNGGWKLDFMAVEGYGAEIMGSGLDTECLKLIIHELCHFEDILTVGEVARHAKRIAHLSIL